MAKRKIKRKGSCIYLMTAFVNEDKWWVEGKRKWRRIFKKSRTHYVAWRICVYTSWTAYNFATCWPLLGFVEQSDCVQTSEEQIVKNRITIVQTDTHVQFHYINSNLLKSVSIETSVFHFTYLFSQIFRFKNPFLHLLTNLTFSQYFINIV